MPDPLAQFLILPLEPVAFRRLRLHLLRFERSCFRRGISAGRRVGFRGYKVYQGAIERITLLHKAAFVVLQDESEDGAVTRIRRALHLPGKVSDKISLSVRRLIAMPPPVPIEHTEAVKVELLRF